LCGGFINRVVAGQEIMVMEKIKGQGRRADGNEFCTYLQVHSLPHSVRWAHSVEIFKKSVRDILIRSQ